MLINLMFMFFLLCVLSSFAIILMGKTELVALVSLSSWYLVIVMWLFLMAQWIGELNDTLMHILFAMPIFILLKKYFLSDAQDTNII